MFGEGKSNNNNRCGEEEFMIKIPDTEAKKRFQLQLMLLIIL